MDIIQTIIEETNFQADQISNVINLLNSDNTIPFIARYRKEITNGLDEVQLRLIRDRFEYLTELEERKQVVLKSVDDQGKLTDELKQKIEQTLTKQSLEDLYLPYKPKKRTRATIAREKGLEPLAVLMRDQAAYDQWLNQYLDEHQEETTKDEAQQSARDILAEWISEDVECKEKMRELGWNRGVIKTEVQKEFAAEKTKFEMYYDFNEPIAKIPAHRYLAIRRGDEESVLKIKFEFPTDAILELITSKWINPQKERADDLQLAIQDSYKRLISLSLEADLRLRLKTMADDESIKIFGENLRNLLLAPLGGSKMILGLDPGFKSGTKLVVVDETGKLLEKGIIYPTPPQNQIEKSRTVLNDILKKFPCELICIGNGTGSREIMDFTREFLKSTGNTKIQPIIVNESGASVYSASDIARDEFPDLDVSFRGSVSIARRFQDPLAELVKIDPKSIGVGQYQHDVSQRKLKKSLDEVVESCVNYVGVNLNTASAPLLSYISGLTKSLAKRVVTFRDENGPFNERQDLLKISRFGSKSFEQAAGFLRIKGGKNPLDQSAVHPENYPFVLKIADDLKLSVHDLIGNESVLNNIDISKYKTDEIGMLTLRDILNELKKPGRDPRSSYVGAQLKAEVQTINHLTAGMDLEGTVTNLTKFGAFVDVGVHHDGLVHLSELSDNYIKEPGDVCSVGDVVKVHVLKVDLKRKRIALSMRTSIGQPKKRTKVKKNKKQRHPGLTGNIKLDLAKLAEKFKGVL